MNTKTKIIAAIITTAILGTGAIAMTQDQPTPTQQVLATPEASPAPVAIPDVVVPQVTPVSTVAPVAAVQAKPVVSPAPPIPEVAKPTPRPVANDDGSVYVDDTVGGVTVRQGPTPRVRP